MNQAQSFLPADRHALRQFVSKPVYQLVISWVLLFPLLFLTAHGSFSIDHQSQNQESQYGAQALTSTGSGSTLSRLELLFVCATLCFAMFKSAGRIATVLKRDKLLLLLPLLALLSPLWSQAPLNSLVYALANLVVTLFAVYATLRFTPERQVELFLSAGIIMIALSLGTIAFLPSMGIDNFHGNGAWQGICTQKNPFATAVCYLVMPAFYVRASGFFQKAALGLYFVVALVCVIMSQARTGWLLFAISVAFVVFLKVFRRTGRSEKRLIVAFAVPLIALVVITGVAYSAEIAIMLGKDPTLTGRTVIYSAIFTELQQTPLLGFGYRAFFIGLTGESANFALRSGLIGLGNAENPILEIWLELGIVGVICLFILVVQCCRNIVTCLGGNSSKYIQWCVMMIFLNLLSLLGGDKIMDALTLEWLVFAMAYVSLSAQARQIRSLRAAT
jgi:O-antigen ligase